MRAITLEQPGRFAMTEVAEPAPPGDGEAKVRVHRVGVCGTDLHAFAGNQPFFEYPRILGHELGGEVIEVGRGVTNVAVGDLVSVEPYLNCGQCIACRRGRTNCCAELKVLGVHIDGGMLPYLTLPAVKLHGSRKLALDQLALVETLCIGAHAVERAAVHPGEWALIIGVGPIGLSVIQFAQVARANIIAMDISDDRLRFCRKQLGVEHTTRASGGALDQVRELTGGDLPTTVFDATGSEKSMAAAFNFVAPSGQLVLVGITQADVAFSDPHLHRREITVKASRNATAADFCHVIGLIEEGRIDTTPWITHRANFEEMIGRFESWTKPETGCIKAMIELS